MCLLINNASDSKVPQTLSIGREFNYVCDTDRNLTKDCGHNRGVFDVRFSIEKGEVYGFSSPNGAGKNTTIRHIMGFSRPQKGHTSVSGLDSWKNAQVIQKNLGYLPGDTHAIINNESFALQFSILFACGIILYGLEIKIFVEKDLPL